MKDVEGYIPYPCCSKEKMLASFGVSGRVSVKCPKCGKFAEFNLDSMQAPLSGPMRGVVNKLNRKYRPSH